MKVCGLGQKAAGKRQEPAAKEAAAAFRVALVVCYVADV